MSTERNIWRDILNGVEVGGRATDVSQLAASIRVAVIDELSDSDTMPIEIHGGLVGVIMMLEGAEDQMKRLAMQMLERG